MSIYIEDKNGKRRKFAGVGSEKDYIDDGIASEKMTWSSEKILDTLCPPFTETGNPITCNPVEDYPLSAVVTLKPKQAGSGDPSPENVRPISGYDSVTVTRCGKNLLDTSGSVRDGYNVLLPNATLVKGATYTFTVPNTVATDKHVALFVYASDTKLTNYLAAGISATFAVPNDVDLSDGLMLACVDATSLDNVNPSDFMVELGSTPTPYEPYQPGTTATLTLPETIYGGTVDVVTGVGEKAWGYIASYNGESLPGEWISDRDVYSAGATPTTGAQVAYKLATPEPFQATGNQALPAVAGLNTIYTDGNSLTVSGSTSPISAIESFKADVQASANQAEAVANILLGGA